MQHLLKNILASGYFFDDSEYELKLKFILFNSLLIFNSIIVGAASIVRFENAQYGQFFIDIVSWFFCDYYNGIMVIRFSMI